MDETSTVPQPSPTADEKSAFLRRLVATQRYHKFVAHKCRLIHSLWESYDRFVMSAPPERFFKSFNESVQPYESYSSPEIQTEIWRLEKLTFQHRDLITAFETARCVYGVIQ